MITYKMHFIRTGRTSAEAVRPYTGQMDVPLCPEGVEGLELLRRECAYPPVQMVFTSPLQRCLQTAGLLYPDTYTEAVDGLRDMHLGRFQGKTVEELKDDEAFTAWLRNSQENPPPGGEDLGEFTGRIVAATREVFQRMMDEKLTSAAVVTHGGVIMSLLAGIGLPKRLLHEWAVPNGAGYTVLFTPQMWMRDGCAEVYALLPGPPESGGAGDGTDDWQEMV